MTEVEYLDICIELIEKKQKLGSSRHWTIDNFKKLSNLIYTHTHVLISVDTLKRIFGKKRTSRAYSPHVDTKNALAIFLGYSSWEDFKLNFESAPFSDIENVQNKGSDDSIVGLAKVEPTQAQQGSNSIIKLNSKQLLVISFLILIIFIILFFFNTKAPSSSTISTVNEKIFSLKGENLVGKVPHTAVIHYDISELDSKNVQISFGDSTITPLPSSEKIITHVYRIPNYYRIQLIVDGKRVNTDIRVQVNSSGWKSYLFYDKDIDNIKSEIKNGILRVTSEEIYKNGADTTEVYAITYNNIRDFDASGDDMTFETRIKSEAYEITRCATTGINLHGDRGQNFIFTKPGCMEYAFIKCSEMEIKGKYTNLSALALTIDKWHTYKIRVKNKKAQIFCDNNLIYTIGYKEDIGKLRGIIYKFTNGGIIDFVRLYNGENELVYEDNFD